MIFKNQLNKWHGFVLEASFCDLPRCLCFLVLLEMYTKACPLWLQLLLLPRRIFQGPQGYHHFPHKVQGPWASFLDNILTGPIPILSPWRSHQFAAGAASPLLEFQLLLHALNLALLLSTFDPAIHLLCSVICWAQSASKFSQFRPHLIGRKESVGWKKIEIWIEDQMERKKNLGQVYYEETFSVFTYNCKNVTLFSKVYIGNNENIKQ